MKGAQYLVSISQCLGIFSPNMSPYLEINLLITFSVNHFVYKISENSRPTKLQNIHIQEAEGSESLVVFALKTR